MGLRTRAGRGVWTFLGPFLRAHAWLLAGIIALQAASAAAVLALPTLNARVVDDGLLRSDLGVTARLALVMLAVTGVHLLGATAASLLASRAAAAFAADLREQVVGAAAAATAKELAPFSPGTVLTRATGDVMQLQVMVQMTLSTVITAPIMLAGAVALSLAQHPQLAWVIAVTALVLVLAVVLFALATVPESRRMQERTDRVTSIIREQLSGVRPIRMFLREGRESSRFLEANRALTDSSWRVSRYMVALPPVVALIANGSMVLVLWLSAGDVVAGALGIGSVLAFIVYLTYVLTTASSSVLLVMVMPPAQVSARRIAELVDAVGHDEPTGTADSLAPVETLHVSGVTAGFERAPAPAVDGVSFNVERGQIVAVVGSTGAGKSTLARVLAGLVACDGGAVIALPESRPLTPVELRRVVSFVPQVPFLTAGTLRTAITLGSPDLTDEDVLRAVETARATDVVETAGGLDAPVAPGGANLSGGQRQRLALARALATGRPFLVVDDALAAVDGATERAILSGLRSHPGRLGAVVVSQRMSVAAAADRVVVLDRGRVVGNGTFDDLLRTCEEFQQLFASQTAGV